MKHTPDEFYKIVYLFHTSEDKRQTEIAKQLKVPESYVSKVLTIYFDKRMNLGEQTQNKTMKQFVKECLIKNKTI